MNSLVADYGSSGESDNDDANNSNLGDIRKDESNVSGDLATKPAGMVVESDTKKKKKKLLNPLLKKKAGNALLQRASVFYNPFLKEIDGKKSVLERHVKMTANPKDVGEINGKKICWNHRKGKCRFGHNCKYAHQSDLAIGNNAPPDLESSTSSFSQPLPTFEEESVVICSEDNKTRKRKPGLSDGLMPNRKALKMYKKQRQAEQPWLRQTGPYT